MSRRTKIVATLGPVTDTPEAMERMIRSGVDMARINFSHGGADEHLDRIKRFRAAAEKIGKIVAVMADLPGPKLRARIPSARDLKRDETVSFSLSAQAIHSDDIVITEPELLVDVSPGQRILLDDGRLQMIAEEIRDGRLIAKITVGGTLLPNKGINLPDTPLTIAAVTDRDRIALAIAAQAQVDWVALSFVRTPDAAAEVRAAMSAVGLHCPIIAKMERPEAVSRSSAIIKAFDGIMVARGDLGVEIPLEKVPMAQKKLIAEAKAAGKPVITATDMLDSMRTNPRPTRAEASDVSNAIFDGTDAVMLSGETAIGQYPFDAVSCMARIAEETESHLEMNGDPYLTLPFVSVGDVDDPLSQATCELSSQINAKAIIIPTLSGRTARLVARHRPWSRIVAASPSPKVLRGMVVVWGLTPVLMTPVSGGLDRISAAVRDSFAQGVVKAGDLVVVLAGHPIAGGPRQPTIRIVRVGADGSSSEP